MIQAIAQDRTPAWYQARSTGIGASEAAAACGVSRYETTLDLWAKKVGRRHVEATPVMELGSLMEAPVFERVNKTFPIARSAPGMFRHPEIECVLASPDGFLQDGRGLETKVTTERNQDVDGDADSLPIEWLCQAQQQIAVTGVPSVLLAVVVLPPEVREWMLEVLGPVVTAHSLAEGLDNGKIEIRFFDVPRHSKSIDAILKKDIEVWQHVQSNTPPAVDWQHARAAESVRDTFRDILDIGAFKPVSESIAARWADEYVANEKVIAEAEKVRKRIMAEAMLEVGDAAGGILPSGSLLKKICVVETFVEAHTKASYSYLREVKGPKK